LKNESPYSVSEFEKGERGGFFEGGGWEINLSRGSGLFNYTPPTIDKLFR